MLLCLGSIIEPGPRAGRGSGGDQETWRLTFVLRRGSRYASGMMFPSGVQRAGGSLSLRCTDRPRQLEMLSYDSIMKVIHRASSVTLAQSYNSFPV